MRSVWAWLVDEWTHCPEFVWFRDLNSSCFISVSLYLISFALYRIVNADRQHNVSENAHFSFLIHICICVFAYITFVVSIHVVSI